MSASGCCHTQTGIVPASVTLTHRSSHGSHSSVGSRPRECRSGACCVMRRFVMKAKPPGQPGGRCWKSTGNRFARRLPNSKNACSSLIPRSPAMPATNRGRRKMTHAQTQAESRFDRGQRALSRIDGRAGEKVIASLADIAPDFARYVIEFPFGDIYSRPGLDLRAREIATIAALTALGNASPQLKVHVEAGLNVGLSRDEITEVIMQMAVYAGFPAALNGLFVAKEIFALRATHSGETTGS